MKIFTHAQYSAEKNLKKRVEQLENQNFNLTRHIDRIYDYINTDSCNQDVNREVIKEICKKVDVDNKEGFISPTSREEDSQNFENKNVSVSILLDVDVTNIGKSQFSYGYISHLMRHEGAKNGMRMPNAKDSKEAIKNIFESLKTRIKGDSEYRIIDGICFYASQINKKEIIVTAFYVETEENEGKIDEKYVEIFVECCSKMQIAQFCYFAFVNIVCSKAKSIFVK